MRRSAVSSSSTSLRGVARRGRVAGERVEGENHDVGVVRTSRILQEVGHRCARRRATRRRRPSRPAGTRRGRPAHHLRPSGARRSPLRAPFAPRDVARARAARGPDERARAPPGARHRWPPPCRRPFQGGGAGLVVTGLALRSTQARDLVCLRLLEAEASRCLRSAGEVADGVVEPVLESGQLAEIASPRTLQPRVLDRPQPAPHLLDRLDAALLVTGGDRGPGGEEPRGGLVPGPVELVVEGAAAIGQLHRAPELAVMRHDVGQVVAAARVQVHVVDASASSVGCGDVVARQFQVAGRGLDPRGQQQSAPLGPGQGLVTGRVERREDPLCASAVAQDDPRPPEPVDDVQRQQRVVDGAPRQERRRCWRARPVRRTGARPDGAAHTLRWTTAAAREPRGVCCEGGVGEAGVVHRLEGERPDAVEQPVPDRARQTRRPQSPDSLRRRPRRSRANGSRAARPRRSPRRRGRRVPRGRTPPLPGKRPREDRKRPEPPFVVGEQQVVAPSDRRPE